MSAPRPPVLLPLLLAIQFLTRLPVSRWIPPLDPSRLRIGLAGAVIWFPLVGGLVGVMDAAVLAAAETLWPRVVAVVLMLMVEARLTGAFHEDAVADFCDGMGGGRTPERIREIMKDSRIGTYGALGLVLAVGLRGALLIAVPTALLLPALLASAALGRWLAVLAMATIPPLRQGESLVKGIGQQPAAAVALLAGLPALPFLLPLGLNEPLRLGGALGLSCLFLVWLRAASLRRLGGVSGDCLGFAVYAGQLIVLLCSVAAWPA